jgi:hypothetical protein
MWYTSTCVKQYNEYVNDIIMDENHKPKRLWSFIKGTGYEYDGNVFVAWVLQVRRAEVVTK